MNIFLVIILLITGGCFLDKNMQNNELPIIPLENFFKNPEKSSFQISPNGQFISYMKPWEEGNRRMNVYVKPFDSEEEMVPIPGSPTPLQVASLVSNFVN